MAKKVTNKPKPSPKRTVNPNPTKPGKPVK